ncbi:unnamed protein product [Oppiella nova]|uniref:Uncharacterized protein n=1 Tax=Oppiella nova TaxID=334625 RepID=A0A7R9MPN8_9ACAR|nr:unnamed protein product [Oppiella nova]CAG2180062.1 unnamed protein product [Oppiella nova]
MNHIGGFITFIKPGTACIVLAGGVAISGLTEKALFSLTTKGKEYRNLPEPALLINAFGVSIVVFIIAVLYLVTRPQYARKDVPAINKKD